MTVYTADALNSPISTLVTLGAPIVGSPRNSLIATLPLPLGAPIVGSPRNSLIATLEAPFVDGAPVAANSPVVAASGDSPIAAAAKLLGEVDAHGNTQLHRCRDPEVAEALLAVGIKVDIPNFGGSTPLHFVCGHDLPDVARVLIEHGANTSARDEQDISVLHGACGAGNLEVAALLLERGARVDPRDFEANTPLHWAARRGHTECVKLLIKHGAEVDAENAHGLTPYFVAMLARASSAADALMNAGADLYLWDRAAFVAMMAGAASAAEALAAADADVHHRGHGPIDDPRIAAIGPAHAAIAALIIDWQDARAAEQ